MGDFVFPTLDAADLVVQGPPPGARLLDVRRPAALAASGLIVDGAIWADPLRLRPDDPALSGAPLIIYCAHGAEISHYVTAMALVMGYTAHLVPGGFAALQRAGAKTVPLA